MLFSDRDSALLACHELVLLVVFLIKSSRLICVLIVMLGLCMLCVEILVLLFQD